MTEEQKAWWALNFWIGLPCALELILVVGLIAALTIPAESFPKKTRAIVITTAALLIVPAALYISTMIFSQQFNTFKRIALEIRQ